MHYRIRHGSIKIGQRFAAQGEVVALSPMDAGQLADVLEEVVHAAPDEASDGKLTEHEQKLATPTPPSRKRRKEVKP